MRTGSRSRYLRAHEPPVSACATSRASCEAQASDIETRGCVSNSPCRCVHPSHVLRGDPQSNKRGLGAEGGVQRWQYSRKGAGRRSRARACCQHARADVQHVRGAPDVNGVQGGQCSLISVALSETGHREGPRALLLGIRECWDHCSEDRQSGGGTYPRDSCNCKDWGCDASSACRTGAWQGTAPGGLTRRS